LEPGPEAARAAVVIGKHALMDADETGRREVRRCEDAAVGTMRQHRVIKIVLAGHHGKTRFALAQQFQRLGEIARGALDADDIGLIGQREQRVVGQIDRDAVGNVVDDDLPFDTAGRLSEKSVQCVRPPSRGTDASR
jgi:hypothetical protein